MTSADTQHTMIERVLALALLLIWQAALLSAADLQQGLLAAASSFAVGRP